MMVTPESTVDAADWLRNNKASVVFRGAGTKDDWGGPVDPEAILDTTGIAGVIEHVPGDLVVVVRAGTRLSALQESLAEKGQQLALDSPHPHATVGGVVAANVSGPRRLRYGTARDLLIGITIVRPDGVIARAGGKVVKNVAGYDLGKLFVGSYGTLGLITECAFRLHPLPARELASRETFDDIDAAVGHANAARLSTRAPIAIELDWQETAHVSVVYDGVPEWTLPEGDWLFKMSCPLSRLGTVLHGTRDAAVRHEISLHVKGSLGVGVLYAGAAEASAAFVNDLRQLAQTVVLKAPTDVDLWGPVPGLDLMRAIKAQFDPAGRIAAGRFVGGI